MTDLKRGLAPLHPGEHLKMEQEALEMTNVAFARLCGISRQHLDRIFKGQSPITTPVATHISAALGTSARFWLNLQANYDIWHYREENKDKLAKIEAVT